MGKRINKLREAADSFREDEKKKQEEVAVNTEQPKIFKRKTKYFSMEIIIEDWIRLEAAMGKLSSRDNTMYKRKDIYIAMSKYFLDAVEKNIDKIKVEKF